MNTLPDLFPGFDERRIKTSGAEIFLRTGGNGPPLLCLHGYPQSHVMWHRVAPELAKHFTLVCADLRGYGASSCPPTDTAHETYGKRAMALDMVEVMAALGHDRFRLAAHDRGARVAYRLALDHGDKVERLAVLDIVPTLDAWVDFNAKGAMGKFHWTFLAQAAPLPETVIGADPVAWHETLMARWSAAASLTPFAEEAMAHYRSAFSDPAHIHAFCEDYRAGYTVDHASDRSDQEAGNTISCPTLVLWGGGRSVGTVSNTLEVWQTWCEDVRGQALPCGHFLAEERPEETAALLSDFFQTS